MTPQEIQEIKDKAATEFGYKDSSHFNNQLFIDRSIELAFEKGKKAVIEGYTADEVERAVEANISAKREIRVPSNEDVEKQFPAFALTSDETKVPLYGNQYKEEGANWAIERVKEMNK